MRPHSLGQQSQFLTCLIDPNSLIGYANHMNIALTVLAIHCLILVNDGSSCLLIGMVGDDSQLICWRAVVQPGTPAFFSANAGNLTHSQHHWRVAIETSKSHDTFHGRYGFRRSAMSFASGFEKQQKWVLSDRGQDRWEGSFWDLLGTRTHENSKPSFGWRQFSWNQIGVSQVELAFL